MWVYFLLIVVINNSVFKLPATDYIIGRNVRKYELTTDCATNILIRIISEILQPFKHAQSDWFSGRNYIFLNLNSNFLTRLLLRFCLQTLLNIYIGERWNKKVSCNVYWRFYNFPKLAENDGLSYKLIPYLSFWEMNISK